MDNPHDVNPKSMADYLYNASCLMWGGHQRLGQALVNALPNRLNSLLRDTEFDPFYDDEKIPAFLAWVEPHIPKRTP